MSKRINFLLVVSLLVLSNTAFAANWVLIEKYEEGYIYVDKDTVVKKGDVIIYWTLTKLHEDRIVENGTRKVLRKIEAITSSPRQARQLASYGYDAGNRETFQYTVQEEFRKVASGWEPDREIDIALQYAKEDIGDSSKPTP